MKKSYDLVTVFYCRLTDELYLVGVDGTLGFTVFSKDKSHRALYDFDMTYWVLIGEF